VRGEVFILKTPVLDNCPPEPPVKTRK